MKLRYRDLVDLPQNVSHAEYRNYLNRIFCRTACFLVGGMILIGWLLGLATRDQANLSHLPKATVQQILNGDVPEGACRITGLLTAKTTPDVPGAAHRKVLIGKLNVTAQAEQIRGDGEGPRAELLTWNQQANELLLADKGDAVAVALTSNHLKLKRDRSAKAKVISERVEGHQIPRAVDFDGVELPLPDGDWSEWTTPGRYINVEADLQTFDDSQTVTLIAVVSNRNGQPFLTGRNGEEPELHMGTVSDIATRNRNMLTGLPIFAAMLFTGGVVLHRSARQQYFDFVRRSNAA